jgi:uncharacterized beta-barrel protein YwiB (DUF1934 family)
VIYIINFYLKNNDEEINKNISIYNKEKNILKFNIDNDSYNIDLGKFILIKDNSESTLNFKFNDKKETNGTYYIKDIDITMDARIKTNKLIYKDNKLEINYELYLQDEYIGKFELIIKE